MFVPCLMAKNREKFVEPGTINSILVIKDNFTEKGIQKGAFFVIKIFFPKRLGGLLEVKDF